MKYRAEIDGLRALAVLPVILFHAGFEWFNGGFIVAKLTKPKMLNCKKTIFSCYKSFCSFRLIELYLR